MTDALSVLAADDVDNYLSQYNGLQDVLRMLDTCPQLDTLFTSSKKELLRYVARDMVVKKETTNVQLNLARNVIEFLPLLVNRPGFEDGAEQECGKILNRSLDFLEISSFTEKPGQTAKFQRSQGFQLSNLNRLHLQFWISQTLTKSLTEQHVRRMASVLEKHWKKAEDAGKARDEDPAITTECLYEKSSSVQARLHVLQKLLYQVPALMRKDPKRWLMRLLEESTNSRYPEIRKIATDIGIATASDMGSRKEVAQAMLSIMTNTSKSKDRNYVQRRITCLVKRLNGKDIDKDLLPDTWVFPLLYMQHPDVKAQAWNQLASYRDFIQNCFKTEARNTKLASLDALRKLITAELETGNSKQRLQEIWQWMVNWFPAFERLKQDADFKKQTFLSALYTYFRFLQNAIPATQPAQEEYLDQVWEVCVMDVVNKLDQNGTTRTHKTLACRILASLFEKSHVAGPNDIWTEHEEFGTGLGDVQPFNSTWIRSRLPQVLDVILPFLEHDVTTSEGTSKNDDLWKASMLMWTSLLHAISNTNNNMDFTSSGRKEFKKIMAHITNHLSSLWKSTASSPSSNLAVPRYFSLLFAAVERLEPANFSQNHIFSVSGGDCDASTPTQKGQKPQSACLHLSALMVRSLFSKSKLCENRQMQSSLSQLWSQCLDSRNTLAEKLDFLHSLSETMHVEILREGKADAGCKQAKLVFVPIFKLAAHTFAAFTPSSNSSTFNRQPYDHTLRIIEIALDCATPDIKQLQDVYFAMRSSLHAQTLSLNRAKPGDAAHVAPCGDTGVAIVLTAPHAKMILQYLNDTRPTESQPAQKFLLEYVTTIIKNDKRLTSRVEFKNGRGLFESASERVVTKTIEQHYSDLHCTVNKAIALMYGQDDGSLTVEQLRVLAELVDALIDHVESTPAPKQSIITFVQEGLSLLVRDSSSKVFAKSTLASKVCNNNNTHYSSSTNFGRLRSSGKLRVKGWP